MKKISITPNQPTKITKAWKIKAFLKEITYLLNQKCVRWVGARDRGIFISTNPTYLCMLNWGNLVSSKIVKEKSNPKWKDGNILKILK